LSSSEGMLTFPVVAPSAMVAFTCWGTFRRQAAVRSLLG